MFAKGSSLGCFMIQMAMILTSKLSRNKVTITSDPPTSVVNLVFSSKFWVKSVTELNLCASFLFRGSIPKNTWVEKHPLKSWCWFDGWPHVSPWVESQKTHRSHGPQEVGCFGTHEDFTVKGVLKRSNVETLWLWNNEKHPYCFAVHLWSRPNLMQM